MAVFLLGQDEVTSGTVTPTEIPHVSDNGNIMRVRAALKALAMGWNPWQTIPLCSQGRAYGPGAKGGVSPTENLKD